MAEKLEIVIPADKNENAVLDVAVGPGTPGWDAMDVQRPVASARDGSKSADGMGMSRIWGKNWRPRYLVLQGYQTQLNLTSYIELGQQACAKWPWWSQRYVAGEEGV